MYTLFVFTCFVLMGVSVKGQGTNPFADAFDNAFDDLSQFGTEFNFNTDFGDSPFQLPEFNGPAFGGFSGLQTLDGFDPQFGFDQQFNTGSLLNALQNPTASPPYASPTARGYLIESDDDMVGTFTYLDAILEDFN